METIQSGNFTFTKTAIDGVIIVDVKSYGDERGYFMETYKKEDFIKGGIDVDFVQDNQSASVKGVLRGLHYQIHHPQSKLVRVVEGAVFDVAVDLRKGSETYGKWVGVELSAENRRQLFIPRGFAHGFLVLSERAVFCYKCDDVYHPNDEGGLMWNDSAIGIQWPAMEGDKVFDEAKVMLSDKDQHHPVLSFKESKMIKASTLQECLMEILTSCERGVPGDKVILDICEVMEGYKALITCCPELVDTQEYQDLYCSFYMAGRMAHGSDAKVRKGYFDLLKHQKVSKRPFGEVLADVCRVTGRREVVFSTKLVATADPHEPVIDGHVRDALGIDQKDVLRDWPNGCCSIYETLRGLYHEFLTSASASSFIKRFDAVFPSLADLTPEKKIDVLLWQKDVLLSEPSEETKIPQHWERLAALRARMNQ